ncbi:citramalate synthase [Rubrimonas cliftonensis]|uniref:Citramalate synthase n=1 Tax=Rubrimonas cliftonensis TaxID=89524 RepID=A0A1H3VRA2_9RHOB|nr:citramalate synthase [Rubrimonas cliftonensis]SDZ77345.1 2-isopropylmalate synthase [Rubrimonas cliftonensis]
MTDRLSLFDTTLRDGQQTQGVGFSAEDKRRIAESLDRLGVDYIEGGWPGANPTDSAFFAAPPKLKRATLTAFGMTKRAGRSAANDEVLAEVVNAGTPAVCLVGKTHVYHVKHALGISRDDNLANIRESLARLRALGREALFDAEHFFDGFAADPDYAMACLDAAIEGGAAWVVLCDTNGGAMPAAAARVVERVCARFGGGRVGIHAHDDTGQAVALSLAAVEAGARQVQGTLNGLGERCGNANLVSIIPTLMLKAPYRDIVHTGVNVEGLRSLPEISRMLDEVLNRQPNRHAPYVGAAAFAHKAGLHASAIVKDPTTYEHVPPEVVGNERVIPMSNQAGKANLLRRLREAGIEAEREDRRLAKLLALVKTREEQGFAYDSAQASFEMLAREAFGQSRRYFDVERFRVTVERRHDPRMGAQVVSEAVVVVNVDGERMISASESLDPVTKADQGPVNALVRALKRDLGKYQDYIDDMVLTDFKVRILTGGAEAVTRVLIEHRDGAGARWSTVGVSPNIVDASMQALLDAIAWKLTRDGAPLRQLQPGE